jgi:hypothetical protein
MTRLELRCLFVFGCIMCSHGIICADDSSQRIAILNRRGGTPSPGGVYVYHPSGISPVAELIGSRPLNEGGGLLAHDKVTGGLRTIPMSRYRSRGNCGLIVGVDLLVDESHRTWLHDPHECLEIVNRPLTGLYYNQNAEIRIQQWRVSIAGSINRQSRDCDGKVVLCTQVERLRKGRLIIENYGNEDEAKSVLDETIGPLSVQAEWSKRAVVGQSRIEVPVVGNLVLAGEFRELQLIDPNSSLSIHFALSGR